MTIIQTKQLDRVVRKKEFMEVLGCKVSEFERFRKMPNFPKDTGVYMKAPSWWLSDIAQFIEDLKQLQSA